MRLQDRVHKCLAVLVGVALSAACAGALADQPVDGLIVRLKVDAVRQALDYRADQAAATSDQRIALAVQRESALRVRLASVLRNSGTVVAGASIAQPVGRAGHLVRWMASLSRGDAQALADTLSQSPEVESVELDTMEQRLAASGADAAASPTSASADVPTPSDPLYRSQAWLQGSGATTRGLPELPSAWKRSTGSPVSSSPYVAVAVIDTGMLADHPDLSAKWLPGYDFVSRPLYANDGDGRDADPSDPGDWVTLAETAAGSPMAGCTVDDSSWHGTLIAGQIAASTNNNVGIAGVNWEARIVPVRVGGKCGAQLSDIIDGMRWAAGLTVLDANGYAVPANPNPVRVMNLSFGSSAACGAAFQDAIDEIAAVGAVVVAAAGNAGGVVNRPANCRGTIGVGALNLSGFKAPYSNFGPELVIATVGGDHGGVDACSVAVSDAGILSTHNRGTRGPEPGGHEYAVVTGTSFSAPIVTGTVSLMLALNPGLSVAQIIAALRATARPHVVVPTLTSCSVANPARCNCTTSTCGAGILDSSRALAFAADPTNYFAPSLAADVVDDARTRACTDAGSISPGGLTSINPSSEGTAAAAGSSGGGSIDVAWLVLLMAAIAVAGITREQGARH